MLLKDLMPYLRDDVLMILMNNEHKRIFGGRKPQIIDTNLIDLQITLIEPVTASSIMISLETDITTYNNEE